MAGGVIRFLVDIASKGGSKAQADINNVGKAANKVADAHVVAGKAAHQYFDTQAKGIIGTANSTKSFSKLAQTMNSGGGVVGAYATLAANVFALTAAFNALKGAAAMQQIERGLEALGARTGQTLTVAADGLREVTGMAISTEQALRSSAQVFSAGFNADQLDRLGRVANDTSFALGRNMTDSMDRLTRGVIKLEPELLDELGIMTRLGDATKAYAAELGKSDSALTTTERRQAFFNAVMAEGELKFGGLAAEAGNTKAFDQLSASLVDITKQTLNFLNVAALPLAAIFSTSPLALAGGAILFAATIKNQLLPGLGNLAKRTRESAEELGEFNKKQVQTIASISPADKLLKNINKEIVAGTADYQDYSTALNKSTTALSKYRAELEAGKTIGNGRALTQKGIAYRKEEIEVLESYQQALRKAMSTELEVTARTQAANAITLAGQGQLKESYGQLRNAVVNYNSSLVMSQAAMGKTAGVMTTVRTASFAAAMGIRVLGAAMLNAIPVIGQVVFVVGLLVAAYKGMQSTESKALEKATKAFNEIAKSLDSKIKDLDRINKSTASAGSRSEQAIILETNALIELAEAYTKVQEARAASAVEDEGGQRRNFWTSSINEILSGVSDTAEASKAFKLSIMENIFWIGEQTIADRQMFENLSKVAPEAIIELKEVYGSIENFSKLDVETRRKILESLANDLSEGAKKLRDATKTLVDAQKAVGASMAEFLKSSIPTTPFDKVANDLKEYNKAIAEFNSLVIAGEAKASDLQNLMSSMPESLSSMLSLGSAQFIEDFNLVDNVTKAGEKATATQRVLAAAANERLSTNRSSFELIQQEVVQLQNQFQLAQRSVILAKSENDLINARLKASQNNLNLTAVGLKKRLELENKLIENNVTALRQQKLIVEAQISQQKLRIEEINDQTSLLEIAKDRFELIRQENKERATQRVSAAQETYDNSFRNPSEHRRAKEVLERAQKDLDRYDEMTEKYLNAYDSAINSNKARVTALRSENRSLQLGIESIQNEINAALMTQLSTAEQAALIQERQAEIDRERASQLRDMRGVIEDISDIEAKRLSLMTKGRVTLATEIAAANSRYRLSRETLRQESAERVQQLENERAKSDADKRDQAARTAALKHWDEEIQIARVRADLDMRRLDANYELEQLQRAIFDTGKEGLDWQRDSLSLFERQVSIQKDLSNATAKTAESLDNLYRKRMGFGEKTEAALQADEIRAARLTYEQAVKESEIKKALIDLEFALLEAQQIQLQEELRARKAVLESQNRDGSLFPQIRQLENVLSNMPRINYESMRAASKAIVDETVSQYRNALDEARTPSSGRINSAAYDTRRLREERNQAQVILNGGVQPIAVSAATIISNSLEANVTDPLVTSQTELTSSLIGLRESVDELIGTLSPSSPAASTSATYTNQELAGALGRYLSSQGFRVSEHSEHGGVNQVHAPNSDHYTNRAVDVNIGRGNVEWDNPAMKARFDQVAATLEAVGIKIIWGSAGHFNHLHAAVRDSGLNTAKAIELLADYLPPRIGQAVAREIPEAVSRVEDVVVTGSREEVITPPTQRGPLQEFGLSVPAMYSGLDDVIESMVRLKDHAKDLRGIFADLGPNGQTMLAVMDGIDQVGASLQTMMTVLKSDSTPTERFRAMADVAMASVSSIQAILKSASAARVALIDQEIAAEQKRDGKSAESVAKIASLEKKKDAMQKKAFETNKKLQMAQTIIATASGIAQALTMGPILGPIMAAMIGALGAAQLAIIAGTSYQSTSASSSSQASVNAPSTLTIGKREATVDLAKNNPNAGGELGYLRGARGQGRSAADYSVIGSAYGGPMPRGYGKTAFVVGEHGPETIEADLPMTVKPANDNTSSAPAVPVTFNINTLDASGVEEILRGQRGNIIGMLREAANANGQSFLEDVNVGVYTKPNVGKL